MLYIIRDEKSLTLHHWNRSIQRKVLMKVQLTTFGSFDLTQDLTYLCLAKFALMSIYLLHSQMSLNMDYSYSCCNMSVTQALKLKSRGCFRCGS